MENLGEADTLVVFLDYLRECIVAKGDGLDDEALRRSTVPSGTSLLGLVKHLTMAETFWFQHVFAGTDVVVPESDLEPGDTTESVLAGYAAACAAGNEVVAACDDLERLAVRKGTRSVQLSLRWILVHMIEETARHAGHCDIIREQIDGQVGR
jgi:uncharacterized damage-inducible protein DinB